MYSLDIENEKGYWLLKIEKSFHLDVLGIAEIRLCVYFSPPICRSFINKNRSIIFAEFTLLSNIHIYIWKKTWCFNCVSHLRVRKCNQSSLIQNSNISFFNILALIHPPPLPPFQNQSVIPRRGQLYLNDVRCRGRSNQSARRKKKKRKNEAECKSITDAQALSRSLFTFITRRAQAGACRWLWVMAARITNIDSSYRVGWFRRNYSQPDLFSHFSAPRSSTTAR